MTTKIFYDYQIFSLSEYGGVSRYFHEISSRISKHHDYDVKIVCPFYIDEYFKNHPSSSRLVKGLKIKRVPKTNIFRHTINQKISNLMVSGSNSSIIHETYYATKTIGGKNAKRVVTVHDMIHEKFSSSLDPNNSFTSVKAAAIRRADRVICVSHSTRKDLIEILGIDKEKISTIYHGCSFNYHSHENIKQTAPIEKPYLLYVGKRDRYKNFDKLLAAYATSHQLNQDFQLVCFGGGDFSNSEIEKINNFQLGDKVIQISGDDDMLANLYREATAFVYPSLYEGFGIPPLEAMSFDCPVICSNVSSIPEVVGEAGEYFDPYDLDSMTHAIEKVVYSEVISNNLKKLGRGRIKLFSWDLCAEQTNKIYQSLL
jgi:glycosyltransferase involved in cell wall biosynthesis